MIEYNYFQNQTLEDLNNLGQEGWEITGILINTSPGDFNAFAKRGFQDKTLLENSETGAKFWLSENVSYGDAIVIFFIIVLSIAIIARSIYKFIFQQL